MKIISPEEEARQKELEELRRQEEEKEHSGQEKPKGIGAELRYLWDYEKLPIFAVLAACLLLFSFVHKKLTAKTPLLYVGCVNVAAEEDLARVLTEDYLSYAGQDPKKAEIVFTPGLYLTDNTSSEAFTYSYASRIKILSSIDAGTLDLVLFDQEAFDAFAQNGFLYDLGKTDLPGELLAENIVIQEEETEEGEEQEEEAAAGQEDPQAQEEAKEAVRQTEPSLLRFPMALDLSSTALFSTYSGKVYAGVLVNTERLPEALSYLKYLLEM